LILGGRAVSGRNRRQAAAEADLLARARIIVADRAVLALDKWRVLK
jgi:hypothetical protein